MRWLLPLLLFGMASMPSHASDLDPIAQKLVSLVFAGGFAEREKRREFVVAFTDYCAAVQEAMPTNTPAEDEWVRRESDTTDADKIGRLVGTPEFSRQRLHFTFDECFDEMNEAMIHQSDPISDSSLASEARSLLHAAQSFQNDADILLHATQAGFSGEPYAFDFLGHMRTTIVAAAIATLGQIGTTR